jgi:SAM-dependent methyltransferase
MAREAKAGTDAARDHWARLWDARGEEDVSWFQAWPERSIRMIAAAGAERDTRIVDVGGGASRLVDLLLDAGYRHLTVLDIAGPALERARRRLGRRAGAVTWIVDDATAWRPTETFDLWHDRAVFHFLTRPEERAAYQATLWRALRPGGQAVVATFAPDGPERCSGLPVVRYAPESLARELGAGFRLLESAREDHLTPGGTVQRFQYSRLVHG